MKTIFASTDRSGINAVKWTIRMMGGSKGFASWAVQNAGGVIMDIECPGSRWVRVIWVA